MALKDESKEQVESSTEENEVKHPKISWQCLFLECLFLEVALPMQRQILLNC
jgi:hypothetical protein